MPTKPFYKSLTIRGAIRSFLLLIASTAAGSVEQGKPPSTVNLWLIAEAVRSCYDTVKGRHRAKPDIQGLNPRPDPSSLTPAFSDSPKVDQNPATTTPESTANTKVEVDEPVDPEEPHAISICDTYLKARPEMASDLGSDEIVFAPMGARYAATLAASAIINKHAKLELNTPVLWGTEAYIYTGSQEDDDSHWEILGNEPDNQPKDEPVNTPQLPATPKDLGKKLVFPGFKGEYYTHNPIITGGNFTWGEATHGGTRIPADAGVVYGMIRIAKVMQEIRERFGHVPIQVNSWYRDPATNAAVGGSSMSRHLVGDAVDFVVTGWHPYDVFSELDSWRGSQGGLASSTVFTHIDARGYRARWEYSF